MQLLSPLDFLAMKFTSKTMNTFTKDASGKDIVNLRDAFSDRESYAGAIIRLEKELVKGKRKKSMILTCSWCAKLKDISVDGFSDKEFQRLRSKRLCLKCIGMNALQSFTLHGVKMSACYLCRRLIPESEVSGEVRFEAWNYSCDSYNVCSREECEEKRARINVATDACTMR